MYGFPDSDVRIEASYDPLRPYDHQQAAWNAMDLHYNHKCCRSGWLRRARDSGRPPWQ
jgi:hypothetical protein